MLLTPSFCCFKPFLPRLVINWAFGCGICAFRWHLEDGAMDVNNCPPDDEAKEHFVCMR